ncbi:MAG: GGDEF domain-containing protein [Bacilli bacterium]
MDLIYLLVLAISSVLVLLVSFLFVRAQFEKSSQLRRTLRFLFFSILISIIIDLFNRLHASPHSFALPSIIRYATVITYILAMPTISALWFVYIVNSTHLDKMPRSYLHAVYAALVVHYVLTFISAIPGTNLYFTITNGVYERGNLFFIYSGFFILFYLMTLMVYFRFFYTISLIERYIFFVVFSLPIVSQIIQIFIPDISFIILGNTYSFMILAMSVQHLSATTDFLTGLANRRNLTAFLQRKISNLGPADSFSIIMVDLDNFKNINDTLGHHRGDDALRKVSQFFKNYCKESAFVARLGGDEFIIISDITEPEVLHKHINSLRLQFKDFIGTDFSPFELGFSAGFYQFKKESQVSIPELFAIIDERMFKDKRIRNPKTIDQL